MATATSRIQEELHNKISAFQCNDKDTSDLLDIIRDVIELIGYYDVELSAKIQTLFRSDT